MLLLLLLLHAPIEAEQPQMSDLAICSSIDASCASAQVMFCLAVPVWACRCLEARSRQRFEQETAGLLNSAATSVASGRCSTDSYSTDSYGTAMQ